MGSTDLWREAARDLKAFNRENTRLYQEGQAAEELEYETIKAKFRFYEMMAVALGDPRDPYINQGNSHRRAQIRKSRVSSRGVDKAPPIANLFKCIHSNPISFVPM